MPSIPNIVVVGTMIYMPQGLMGIPESLRYLIRRSKKGGEDEYWEYSCYWWKN